MATCISTRFLMTCKLCQKQFFAPRKSYKFCSRLCASRSNGRHCSKDEEARIAISCVQCNSPFAVVKSYINSQRRNGYEVKFCSQKCYRQSVRERPIPKCRSCTSCHQEKPFVEQHFGVNRNRTKSGLLSVCKLCIAKSARVHGPVARTKLKLQTLTAYGDGQLACVCCGESHSEFLSLDHIDGGGSAERKHTTSDKLHRRLRREGFPKGKYRTLCFNCNWAYGQYGYCPHKNNQKNDGC